MGARKNIPVGAIALEYACELFSSLGVDGTSLADIAKACEISKGTLYYYYQSKDALVCACAESCIRNLGDRIFDWMNALSKDAEAEVVCHGLAEAFLGTPADIRLLLAIFNCSCEAAREMARCAQDEWKVMIEVAALRIKCGASEKLTGISAAVLPLMLGFAVTGDGVDTAAALLESML